MEIWKDIEGYEGLYQVSNLGNVRSFKNGRWGRGKIRILKKFYCSSGYEQVNLSSGIGVKMFLVHRLVINNFKSPENNKEVNHIDGVKTNNVLENLEFVTKSQNHKHRYSKLGHINPMKGKTGINNINSKSVTQFDLQGNFIHKWESMTQASKVLGIPFCSISNCCNRKKSYKTAGGFTWSY